MKKTLLISSSQHSKASLEQLLKEEGFEPVTVSYTAYNAKDIAEREEFDFICINAPLADENGIELSCYFADTTKAGVVIIVPKKRRRN